jgi:hypothetical protein
MTTSGYKGQGSPNRADAFVWAMTELFPGIAKKEAKEKRKTTGENRAPAGVTGWMAA